MRSTSDGTERRTPTYTDEELFALFTMQLGAPPSEPRGPHVTTYYNRLTQLIMNAIPGCDVPTLVAIRRVFYEHHGTICFDVANLPEKKIWR